MQFNSSTYNNEEGIWYGAITGVAAGNGNQKYFQLLWSWS